MKLEIRKFKAEDLIEIEKSGNDESGIGLKFTDYRRAETDKVSYTLRVNGRVVASGGIVDYWEGRGEAWVIPQKKLTCGEALALQRVIKRFLKVAPYRRIEAVVYKPFRMGHRWVKSFGFKLEAETLKAYSVSGGDYSLYARVNNG